VTYDIIAELMLGHLLFTHPQCMMPWFNAPNPIQPLLSLIPPPSSKHMGGRAKECVEGGKGLGVLRMNCFKLSCY